jgi:phosphoribosylformylglycinamidine synthase subunit PurL
VKEVCRKWNINCQYIGKVTSTANIRIYNKDNLEGEIPIKTLTELSPVYHHRFEEPKYIKKIINDGISDNEIKQITDRYSLNEIFIKMIGSPNICSKKWVWEQYDHMVQTNTAILPGQDSAVLRIKGKNKAIAFTNDGNGRYCYLDPYAGGAIAVAESARNLVCVGAIPIGITDCLNFGTPEKPEIFWQFKNSVEGMNKACKVLDIPIISGNVSFYNESFGNPIYPTPVSATAGLITKLDYVTTMGFQSEGDVIVLLGASKVEMGGSEFMEVFLERVGGKCPSLNLETEKRLQKLCLSLITGGFVKSAHDCSAGGLGISLLKCCIHGNIGADIKLNLLDDNFIKTLFSESQSRIVITIDKASTSKLEEECRNYKIQFSLLGRVQGRLLKINNVLCADIEEASDVYSHAIEIKMSL